jgi:uncharacterized protein YoxC
MSVLELWWLSLAIVAAVVVVVAILLGLIIATAKSIDRHAYAIWIVGKQIAGNTASIWLLDKIDRNLADISDAVEAMDDRVALLGDALRGESTSRRGR